MNKRAKHNNAAMLMLNENPETGVRRYQCHCGERFTYDPARLENVAPATTDGQPGVMCPTCDCIRPVSMVNGEPKPEPLPCFKITLTVKGQEEPIDAYGETIDLPTFLAASLLTLPFPRDQVTSITAREVSREEFEKESPPKSPVSSLFDMIFGGL